MGIFSRGKLRSKSAFSVFCPRRWGAPNGRVRHVMQCFSVNWNDWNLGNSIMSVRSSERLHVYLQRGGYIFSSDRLETRDSIDTFNPRSVSKCFRTDVIGWLALHIALRVARLQWKFHGTAFSQISFAGSCRIPPNRKKKERRKRLVREFLLVFLLYTFVTWRSYEKRGATGEHSRKKRCVCSAAALWTPRRVPPDKESGKWF